MDGQERIKTLEDLIVLLAGCVNYDEADTTKPATIRGCSATRDVELEPYQDALLIDVLTCSNVRFAWARA